MASAAYMRAKRALARSQGIVLPGDDWARSNSEKHRANVAMWRAANKDKTAEIGQRSQAKRRSTPWGTINNRVLAILHSALRTGASGLRSKYCKVLGYTWDELAAHLEAKFRPGMTWENRGEVWEIDHIKPLSTFRYESIDDPSFRECWGLSNLRPLFRFENASKYTRIA